MKYFTIYLPTALLTCGLFVSCTSDDNPEPAADDSSASFTIVKDGVETTITLDNTSNLIFSRDFGRDMWIRLAENKTANGNDHPHLDIDLCRYSGPGTYEPVDPQARPCSREFGWDLWWHGEDAIYFNQADSSPCQLQIEVDGNTITGTFMCEGMIQTSGSGTISIKEGSFRSTITE